MAKPGKKRKRLSGAERREQLLEIAAKIIAAGGAGSLTMEGVAKRAGVSIPIVYKHFANRGDLLLALLESYWKSYDERVQATLDGPGSFRERVAAGIGAYFDSVEERGSVFLTLLNERTTDGPFEERRRERRRNVVRLWARQIQKEYGLPSRTAEAACAINAAAADGAANYWIGNRGVSRARLEEMLLTMSFGLLDSLVAQKQRAKTRRRA